MFVARLPYQKRVARTERRTGNVEIIMFSKMICKLVLAVHVNLQKKRRAIMWLWSAGENKIFLHTENAEEDLTKFMENRKAI